MVEGRQERGEDEAAARRPLVLDVDGTFLKTDLLFETFWAGLGQAPRETLRACWHHWRDPARLKAELAALTRLRTDLMPLNPQVTEHAARARAQGREVVLASAANKGLVARLAEDHGLSGRVFASSEAENLKGAAKARALVAAFGEGGFDYAGDAPVDRAIWEHAHGALVVGQPRIARALADAGQPVESLPGGWSGRDLLRALRPHQWVKNVLLFVPLFAAHDFSLAAIGLVLLGMAAFSAAASAIYIVNDLLDLEADRLHPTKKNRPFAAGRVPIRIGMIAAVALALGALGLAAALGWRFFGVIVIYMVLSLSYSLRLKRMRWIDIATLAALYTLRVVAGAAALGGEASMWLVVFIYPVFLTLGAVKRMTELSLATGRGRLPGRGYGRDDLDDLLNIAWLGMAGALLAFFLYSFSEQAAVLYPSRWLLWLALVPLAWWLRRMVRLGHAGQMDYDPVVFAMKDKRGLGLIMLMLALMFAAAGLWQHWIGG